MKKALGLMIVLIVLGCSSQLNDKARRDHLLMPKLGSKAHAEWVANYGDTADSWQLFTLSFQTKYIQQLTAQVNALTKRLAEYPDPNEIITDPNELARIAMTTKWSWYNFDGSKTTYQGVDLDGKTMGVVTLTQYDPNEIETKPIAYITTSDPNGTTTETN